MLFEVIRDAVESVEELKGRCFPTTARLDDMGGPLVVYTMGKETAEVDLSGTVAWYSTPVIVDILAPDFDQTHRLAREVAKAMRLLPQTEQHRVWIHTVVISTPDEDEADLTLQLNRRALQVTVYWSEVNKDAAQEGPASGAEVVLNGCC